MFANSVGKQKCRVFKKLASILCWPTMLAVYELVHFLLANKRQTVRCDWLPVVNKMVAEWTDAHFVLTTLIILPHVTFALSTTAPKQISGAYVFAYEQLNKSLLQQCRRCLLSPSSPPYCCPTKCCCVRHKCWPTTNADQQLLANICWLCVCSFRIAECWNTRSYELNSALKPVETNTFNQRSSLSLSIQHPWFTV